MVDIARHSTENSLPLADRTLWYDGDTTMTPKAIVDMLLSGVPLNDKIKVTEVTDDVRQFNKLNPSRQLNLKTMYDEKMDTFWNITDQYLTMDVSKHIFTRLLEVTKGSGLSDSAVEHRIKRIETELELFHKYNIIDLLRTLIYVVDTFTDQKVVWGTGRGSSCSSYILYLIQLHDVDSVKYDLDINEFFR